MDSYLMSSASFRKRSYDTLIAFFNIFNQLEISLSFFALLINLYQSFSVVYVRMKAICIF